VSLLWSLSSLMSQVCKREGEVEVGKYLKLARKAAVTAKEANTAKVVSIDTGRSENMAQAHALSPSANEIPRESRRRASHKAATKATEATKELLPEP
jgi:hypothetical protein